VRAERGSRVTAAVAGVAAAVATAFISYGASLVAVVAVCTAWLIARRRGKPFTRGISWLFGVGSVALGLVIVLGAFATQVPKASFSAFGKALDSVQASPPPQPPEWLKKITPPNAQQPAPITNSLIRSRAFTIWTGVMGVSFTIALASAYAGTLGWGASMLLLYGATGAWLPRAKPGTAAGPVSTAPIA
jgi:hypothetical protein